MNILAIGDVVNESGLGFLRKKLRGLQRLVGADFTVVNGENAAGTGILPRQADEILAFIAILLVKCFTMSIRVSHLETKLDELVQRIAIAQRDDELQGEPLEVREAHDGEDESGDEPR